ncbi:trafficking protein Mon1-domain-containing protein [Pyronema omphalodes]|nr:trafficking protein Mon1-domain-containing protein [Pyronema omphalodes]
MSAGNHSAILSAHPDEFPAFDNQGHNTDVTIEDDSETPRASFYSEVAEGELNLDEDYFSSPPPSRNAMSTPSELLSQKSAATTSSNNAPQTHSRATVAVSLPEGVYAQQQDAMSSNRSVTTAPSFSDSMSIRSTAPTLKSLGDADVESMLGEILSETESRFCASSIQESIEESVEDEDSDDEIDKELTDEEQLARWRAKKKHFFILSEAGKPVYSRYGSETIISSYIGVLQAIISFFTDTSDTLQSFQSGSHLFVVVSSGPLYLVAISCTGETPAQLRLQLDSLYQQILSTLTLSQLTKAFSGRFNFDLRRLLGGTEVFLDGLVDSILRGSPAILLSALECITLRKTHRTQINQLLLTHRTSTLLYGLIITDSRLVSVIRPKRHSLHPPDLQLLFSMLFTASTFRDGNEHWTPICMPRFNSKGFLHAYIHFFTADSAIVLISADKDAFFELREMAEKVVAGLQETGLKERIGEGIKRPRAQEVVAGTPVRHWIYKSRSNVQFVSSSWEGVQRKQTMAAYQRLHAVVHGRGRVKVAFETAGENSAEDADAGRRAKGQDGMAWVGNGWEVYAVAKRGAKREAVVRGVQGVVKWIKEREERVFVIGGATF